MTLWATTLRATTLFFGGPQSLGRIETMRAGSRTEPEPEFYKPVLRYFCRTLTEPEPCFSKSRRANRN